ncbi:leucyl aminopeptidase family protein [Vampirovibrio chlorellavorus]|uniref:leucyl aminopeptidase family protein n=1 Tax=Vampirovibrio chlorellavorus TaxID=758823 RepID=UPI0026EE42E3|nr:leucyl aminopeptidase family protein [Vampirovibrio chlorellavorus]
MGSAKTRFSFSSEKATSIKADGLIIPVFKKPAPSADSKGKSPKEVDPRTSIVWPIALDKALKDEIEAIAAEEKFDGSKGKTLTVRQSSANKLGARRLVVVGLGEADKVLPRHWEANAHKALAGLLGLKDFKAAAILLPEATEKLSTEAAVSLAVDAVFQATYKSMEAKEPGPKLESVILLSAKKLESTLQQAQALAEARSLVKDLVNHPSNLKSTNTLVEHAKTIGKNSAIKVNVQNSVAWIEKNMPCFFTVAKGSLASDPPKFISLHYAPKSGKAKKKIAIVGKSVIFDTGGYQVKPGDYMVTMKGDMTGGAVALGTMQAMAALQPQNIEVTAYLAATPNKIDSDAMIPDSIVNTTCGKKVEIRHTDAEGRLTLIDAVAKAAEGKPEEILTIATLTGAASVAVGSYIALMGNNEALRDRIAAAGRSQGEPIQTLDVTEDDFENIKSKLDGADIINTSQRKNRGAQTAAAFVMSGAPSELPMAHMDIAGADMTPDEKATGVSVKTIVQYLLNEDASLGGGKANAPKSAAKTAAPKAKVAKAPATAPLKSPAKKGAAKGTPKKPSDRQPPKAKPAAFPKKKK